jgi:2-polyprenyl-3-methyl-5-hydroxy-6-metoxy-1,4-benzoquinol methylase
MCSFGARDQRSGSAVSGPAPDRAAALADRLLGATLGALELFSVYLGTELGLYRTLSGHGPLTSAGLAERAGIAERYAREWLEQQAVAGLIELDDADAPAAGRRYRLPAEHARALCRPDDPAHSAPFAHMLAGIGGVLPQVADAYRTGGGVPYSAYGEAFRHGQGHINRPAFSNELAGGWLAAMPDVVAGLECAQHARIADLGCGQGWSTIALANAFLDAWVDGLDSDPASIDDARRHATEAGLDGRVRFSCADAGELSGRGPYDLIVILEALHDMARPADVLRAAHDALGDGGTLLVVDERVADSFTAPGDELERVMFGWSVMHCLPSQMAEQPSAALGTAMRADTIRALATKAGFARVDVLPVENDFFRLYRVWP